MRRDWTGREFLTRAAASATSLAFAGTAGSVEAQAGESSAMRGRFLTHVSVVRVNQIEVTPDRSIGEDESSDNRPDRIRSRREAFAAGCPDGRIPGLSVGSRSMTAARSTRRLGGCLPRTTTALATRSPSFLAAISHRCTTRASTTGKRYTMR